MKKPFSDLVNDSVRKTYLSEDDKAFQKQQQRKRQPKVRPETVIPDGPCCGRCNHWKSPSDDGDYGTCRITFLTQAVYAENRRLVSYDEYRAAGMTGGDNMRVAISFAACSQYNKEIRREADPGEPDLPTATRR